MTRRLDHDDLYGISVPGDPQLSPDGRLAVWTVTTVDRDSDGYRSRIWAAPVSGEEPPRQLTFGDGDGAPRFSPDGTQLAFVSARAGTPQVHLLPLAGGEARRLTDISEGAGGPVWSPDGTRIAVTVARRPGGALGDSDPVVHDRLGFKADGAGLRKGREAELHVVEVASGKAVRVGEEGVSYGSPCWSPDGKSLAVTTSLGEDVEPRSIVQVLAADGSGQPRTVTPDKAMWSVVDWSPDGTRLLVVGNPDEPGGQGCLATVPVAGGEPVRLAPDLDRNVMVGGPGYPGGRPRFVNGGVVFCVRERGATHAVALDEDAGSVRTLVGDGRSVSGLAVAGDRLAVVVSDAGTPGEVETLSLNEAQPAVRRLTDLFGGAFPALELFRPEEREWTAPDGTALHGWVLRDPAVTGPVPTLLDIHGGPHNAWGPTFDGVHLYHQVLAARGWAVLYLNPRASDGYGAAFWSASRGAWGTGDEQDFHAAVDGLVAEGIADPDRLAVTGYSYGGYMSCWLSARSNRWASAVPGGVIVNMVSAAGTCDLGLFLARYEFGAYPWEEPERLAALSPLTHVAGVTAPTLILHGAADDRCPVGEAEQWFTALRTRGVTTELVRYPGGSHLFILNGRPSHRVDYGRRLVDWVVTHDGSRG